MNYNNILVSKLMFSRPPLKAGCSETPRLPTYLPTHPPQNLIPGTGIPRRSHTQNTRLLSSLNCLDLHDKQNVCIPQGEKRITTWCVSNAKAIGAMR